MRWLLRLLGWDRYQGFVARRYLMVPERRVSRIARLASSRASASPRRSAGAYLLVGAALPQWLSLVGGLALATLTITLLVGVLPYSKPSLYTFFVGSR